jgi:hypothetical protein
MIVAKLHSLRPCLLAAADPVGDATLLLRAARKLAVEPDALAPAQDADVA